MGHSVMERWSSLDVLGGLSMIALVAGMFVTLVLGCRGRYHCLVALIIGAIALQVGHASEHMVQVAYWFSHPHAAAYMTPWANALSRGVGFVTDGLGGRGMPMARGMETLHLIVNLTFLLGTFALVALARAIPDRRALRSARAVMAVQAAHCVEHALLTVTLFTTGRARGLSTLFGVIPPNSPGAVSYRVLFHFTINVVGLVLAVRAIRDLAAAGALAWRPRSTMRSRTHASGWGRAAER
jgi:hypothetical protein